ARLAIADKWQSRVLARRLYLVGPLMMGVESLYDRDAKEIKRSLALLLEVMHEIDDLKGMAFAHRMERPSYGRILRDDLTFVDLIDRTLGEAERYLSMFSDSSDVMPDLYPFYVFLESLFVSSRRRNLGFRPMLEVHLDYIIPSNPSLGHF